MCLISLVTSVMNTARYPEAVKIAYEKRLKSIYCA